MDTDTVFVIEERPLTEPGNFPQPWHYFDSCQTEEMANHIANRLKPPDVERRVRKFVSLDSVLENHRDNQILMAERRWK